MVAKQNFLRESIPEDKYEDFMDFCENFAGNLEEEFENWTMNQLHSIVWKFGEHQREKESKAKQQQDTQSYYAYQTGNEKELKELREQLRKEQNQQEQKPAKSPQSQENNISPENFKTKNQQTAI